MTHVLDGGGVAAPTLEVSGDVFNTDIHVTEVDGVFRVDFGDPAQFTMILTRFQAARLAVVLEQHVYSQVERT